MPFWVLFQVAIFWGEQSVHENRLARWFHRSSYAASHPVKREDLPQTVFHHSRLSRLVLYLHPMSWPEPSASWNQLIKSDHSVHNKVEWKKCLVLAWLTAQPRPCCVISAPFINAIEHHFPSPVESEWGLRKTALLEGLAQCMAHGRQLSQY